MKPSRSSRGSRFARAHALWRSRLGRSTLKYAPQHGAARAAASMSASSRTTMGPLPEASMIARLRPAVFTIFSAVADDPMKPIASIPGWLTNSAPKVPSPGRMLTSGRDSRPPRILRPLPATSGGVCAGGLTTIALPVARPRSHEFREHEHGEVPGDHDAPGADRLVEGPHPLCGVVGGHCLAVEADGILRVQVKELRGLVDVTVGLGERPPLLEGEEPERSWSRRAEMRSPTRCSIFRALPDPVLLQERCADCAAATARSRSALPGAATEAMTLPVTGLTTSAVRPSAASTYRPARYSWVWGTAMVRGSMVLM